MAEQIKSLKTGIKYKDTPIGWIPVDWEIKHLIDTAKDEPYSFTGGPFGSNLKESSYTDSGVRIIQLQNIGDGAFLDEYQIFTSEEKADQLKSCNIYPGDIIIAKMADPVARACLIPNADKRYLMASDGIRLSVSEKLYDKKFILYSVNSKYFRENAGRHSSGTTRLRIGLTELKNLPLAIPPIVEQKKIAEILSTVDEAIEKTDQIIEKTKEAKKGLMQRLLARGIGHKKFKKTIIGKIPIEWNIGKLGDMCIGQPEYGANVSAIDKDVSLPRYVRITDITEDGGLLNDTWQSIQNEHARPYMLTAGDILFARSGATVGKTYLYNVEDGKCAFAGYLIRFKPNPKILLPEYLFHCTHSDVYYNWIKGMYRAGAQPNINAVEYSSMLLPTPPIAEQKVIVRILDHLKKNIDKELYSKEHLNSLKTGLMQVLLTGRIRVKV
jgi:type I restriction enzyme S subunit